MSVAFPSLRIAAARRIRLVALLLIALPLLSTGRDNAEVASDPDVVNSDGYLARHPDQSWRAQGVQALREGRSESAITYLRRAASYADKPSQALLGALFWEGIAGVPANRPVGYAWMDLAAERGYRDYLATREQYWSELDDAGRKEAQREGRAIHAEYADAVAQPRLNRVLRLARSEMTGSRVGAIGPMTILPSRGGDVGWISGDRYYDARHWDPRRYWEAQDALWNPVPQGRAEVGAPRAAPAETEP